MSRPERLSMFIFHFNAIESKKIVAGCFLSGFLMRNPKKHVLRGGNALLGDTDLPEGESLELSFTIRHDNLQKGGKMQMNGDL